MVMGPISKAIHDAASTLAAPAAAVGVTAVVAANTFDAGQFVAVVGVPAAILFALLWLAWRVFAAIKPDLAAWLRANTALASTVREELSQIRTAVEANTLAMRGLRRELRSMREREQ